MINILNSENLYTFQNENTTLNILGIVAKTCETKKQICLQKCK